MKKKRSGRRKTPPRKNDADHTFAVIKVDGEYGEVVFPIGSESEIEDRREELTERAREFHRKGLFIREVTSPDFLSALASKLAVECNVQFQELLAARVAVSLLEEYGERLKVALDVDSWKDVISDRPFLETSALDRKSFLFKPRPDFADRLVEICSTLIEPFFGPPGPPPNKDSAFSFWWGFTEFIWINQMAQAIEDLEDSIGSSALEQMPTASLFDRVVAVYSESSSVRDEFVRLANWYLQNFGDILTSSPMPDSVSLRQFEILLGLIDKPDQQRALIVELGSLAEHVRAALLKPTILHQISPRRFEEVVAYGLEKSGFDEVRLTPQTRDGGFDIEAFRYGPIKERLLVECKRYSASRKVGRPTLDALLGVLHRERANQALLATTSSFSKEAKGLLKDEQWRLQGMDLDELLRFLRGISQK